MAVAIARLVTGPFAEAPCFRKKRISHVSSCGNEAPATTGQEGPEGLSRKATGMRKFAPFHGASTLCEPFAPGRPPLQYSILGGFTALLFVHGVNQKTHGWAVSDPHWIAWANACPP